MRRYPRLMLLLGGALAGAAFGLSFWFLWGCTRCAEGSSPVGLIGFCVVVSAVMTERLGKDHFSQPPRG